MVKFCYFFIFIFGYLQIFANVTIESNINQNTGYVHFPIAGTITVTSEKNARIDPESFEMEGKPLPTSFVKKVNLTGNAVISIYSFSLPDRETGLHLLPSISVKVDNKIYRSLPTGYSVVDSAPSASTNATKEPPVLTLEAFVKGPSKLFPGERTTLVYRISFNHSIDLTKSELPFIHTTDFLKVGDAQIHEEQQGALTIQEISQVVEASAIGSFVIGPSFVEGYAYQINLLGKKEYDSQLLHAEAPPVEIKVSLFSNENRPASFNGAIGKIEGKVSLLTSEKVSPGHTIRLVLTVSGISNLSDFHMPPLQCQPGFSGLFFYDEVATRVEREHEVKKFYFDLQILNSSVFEVPSIEISSFDSALKNYRIVRTAAIPLKMTIPDPGIKLDTPLPLQTEPGEERLKVLFSQTVSVVPLPAAKVTDENFRLPLYQRNWVLYFIPAGLLFLVWQYLWHRQVASRPQKVISKSKLYLHLAEKSQKNSEECLKLLEKALLWKLVECGIYERAEIDLAILPLEGDLGKYRMTLSWLQSLQFGLDRTFDAAALINEVRKLIE